MPTSLIPTDVLEIRVYTKGGTNQEGLNVLHYRVVSVGSTPSTDADIASGISAVLAPRYKPMMYSTSAYDGVQVSIVSRTPRPVTQVYNSDAGPGTGGTGQMPPQTCGLISWRTLLGGRAFRGRTYIPFPSSDMNSATGFPTTGYATLTINLANAILGYAGTSIAGRTATLAPVIWHKLTRTTTDIWNAFLGEKWATQRRRSEYGKNRPPPV
jgi:hypothetical protein